MQAFIEIFRLMRAKNIIFVHNACLNKGYSAAFEASFGYFERYIAYCTYLWTQRFEAGLFDRPQRQQALRICRIFPLGIVEAYFIYKFGIDITLFFNVNSDWKTAHCTDCIVAGMAERYITSIAQRLSVAVASYSDFVLISTKKISSCAPCGEIRGKRAFFVIFKAHPGNALVFLRTKKIHFALVLLVGQFVYIYKKCQCHYFACIF